MEEFKSTLLAQTNDPQEIQKADLDLLKKINKNSSDIVSALSSIQTQIIGIQSDITNIRSDVTSIQSDITSMQSNITSMQSNITSIQNQINNLEPLGTWASFSPTKPTNLPGNWTGAKWRRIGQNIEVFGSYTATGAATGTITLTGNQLLSVLGITSAQEAITIPSIVGYNGTNFYTAAWNPSTGNFRGTGVGNWTTTVPWTWASGHVIIMSVSLAVTQWV